MEVETYDFEGVDINLDNYKKNDEEYSTPRIGDQEESVCKTLNCENEFKTINHETFSETAVQDSKSKTNEKEEGSNINSTPSVNPIDLQDNNSEFQESSVPPDHMYKDDHSSSNMEVKQETQYKGGVQLVRLQAIPEPPANVRCDAESSIAYDITVNSEDSHGGINTNEVKENPESQSFIGPKVEYQFLTPRIPSTRQQVLVSVEPEGSLQLTTSNFPPLMQPEGSNNVDIPTTSYDPILISSSSVPDFTTPKIEKVRSGSSSVIKTPLWIVNSSSGSDSSGSSMRVNTDSSFQFPEDITQNTSSEFQSSTSVSESPDSQQIQRFVTADNQFVYGYKDTGGEFHFFCPAVDDRETHNEKERKRRSRVSEACSALRKLIPGLTDKTDKATVFEQTAGYLKFLRDKFGSQFDQVYCEKYFRERT